MKAAGAALLLAFLPMLPLVSHASAGPERIWPVSPIAPPADKPYLGNLQVAVDASDVNRRIVHVHESVSGLGANAVLLFPKWLPGTHAPQGPLDRIAGLAIKANGAVLEWTRDPVDVSAFRLHNGANVKVDIDFEYLSPTSPQVGPIEMSRDVLMVEWNEVLLYPAGYFTRQIPVDASLTLPSGWQFGTALDQSGTSATHTVFKRVSVETLIDSPVYAGRYAARLDLDPGAAVPVHLDLFADRPELLDVKPAQLEAHRALVQQAYRLFGSHHYAHYDFLYSLSDQVQQQGLEHHQSSEDGTDPQVFTKWDKTAHDRDLLPHEFTHSWNGKFRRPADLWTPNYDVPMQDSLLWVYEGQTQYWGRVLAARSGLQTRQQALDSFALTAAYDAAEAGRRWRPLEDTTDDEIINPRRPQSWRDGQRFEDYYEEGSLIWLEVDTLIRERSHDKRSLDDFAREFFGIDNGSYVTVTYTFEDVVKALNSVEPYDWAGYLHARLSGVNRPAPLDGVRRGGYKLVYNDAPNELLANSDEQRKRVSLLYSIGVELDDQDRPGVVAQVMWDSPAFKANLTAGSQILAVNGAQYDADQLKDAIRRAQRETSPLELIVKTGDRYQVLRIDYRGGLRYPHLERDGAGTAVLDTILAPRS